MKNLILSLYAILLLNIASFATQLSGTYTVNPAGAANTTNFKNVGSAIGFMSGVSRTDGGPNNSSPFGVSGPVIFEITPGNYPEIIYFNTIGGVSLINTITLQKLTGSTGEIIFNPTNISNLTIFNFNSQAGKFVNFKNLRFQPIITSSFASTSFCIGVGSNINVDNCIFDFANSATNSVYGIYNCNEVVVTNSTFYNSLTTTKYTGSVMGYGSYCSFNNNVVKNMAFSVAGIRNMNNNLFQQSAISITGDFASPGSFADNTLTNATLNFSYINNNQTFTIQRNKINVNRRYFPDFYTNSADAITDPISFTNNGTAGCTVKCINNFIAINQNIFNGPVSGINAGQGVPYALQIFHNTVMVNSIQPDVFPITASIGATVTNNIFWSNTGSKAAINLGAVWNANNYYATVSPAYTHTDANARSENIVFTSASDLHHNTACIKGIATSVITDIDNLPRSASTPIMGATEATNLSIDGAARRIISPVTIINAGVASSQAISFKLVNLGSTTINNVTANYTINNGTATSEIITGLNVAACDSATVTFTTPYSFNPNVGSNIKVTVTQVNGIADANTTNDIAQKYIEVLGPMSGIYTVNPAAPQTPSNFQTIGYADSSMMARSIIGPVTIAIYNGNYSQPNMVLNTVSGASSTNTIKFISFSNDSLQVNINSPFIIKNVPYVTVEKLKFTTLNINYNSPAIIQISETANNVIFKGCNITGILNWNAGNNLTINGNYFLGGLQITGYSGGLINNLLIKKNIIVGGAYDNQATPFLLQCFNVSKPILDSNTFQDFNFNHNYPYSGGYNTYKSTLYFVGCNDTLLIKNNKFLRCSTTRLVGNLNSTPTITTTLSHIEMYNNFITANGLFNISEADNSVGYGVPNSMRYYFNNFYNISTTAGGGFTFGAIGSPSNASGVSLCKNNIFASKYTGVPYTRSAAYPANSDYNCFFTNGSILVQAGTNYANLTAYKAAGFEPNSISINPKYIDSSNLHVQHPALLGAGVPAPTVNPVLFDIDNDNRNALNPAIGADEPMLPSNDVIAVQLLANKKDFTANIAQPLAIKILNNGSAPLNQVKVRWSVNGTEQLPAYSWSGSLAYDSSITINFGSYIFPMMKYTNLKVWTDLPNASPDMVPINDTLRLDSIMPFARGNFTIGGVSPTVPSFTKASEYLNYGGVDSAVSIIVRNGKYIEQPIVKFARGASPTNSITFKGENNNASLDTLSFNVLNTSVVHATMLLDSAAFCTFKNISFQSLSTNSRIVSFLNNSRFITFDSCVFTALTTGNSFPQIDHEIINYGIPSVDSNEVFTNNVFYNGTVGSIKMPLTNTVVKGNRFEGSSNGNVIELSSNTSDGFILIDSNYLKNAGGMYMTFYGTNNDVKITRNQIYNQYNSLIYYGSGTATKPVKIYNNMFGTKGGRSMIINGAYFDILHNSFADSLTNSFNNMLEFQSACNNINLKNNIFSRPGVTSGGINILNFANASMLATLNSNYNAFNFADSSKLIYNGTASISLSQWQTATGKDVNSKRIIPAFKSFLQDLHIDKNKPGALDVYKAGIALPAVPKDIDDSSRSLTTPAIGADEFSLNIIDAGTVRISNLNTPVAPGTNNIITTIRNYGINNITAATINWNVNGVAQTPYSFTGNLATGDSASNINIGNYNFTGINKYDIKVWVNTSGDINATNDTTFKSIYPALCGNYTIAGTTPDFLNMAAAASYASFAGVTCPVVFNIRDGQYLESDTINFIPGASAINTVTFQSQSLDSSKVAYYQSESIFNTTTPTYTYSNSAAVLRINGAQFVKFKALTFKRTPDATYHFYLDVINLVGNASGTSFSNCDISTPGPGRLITASTLTASSDYNINNNLFTGGTNAFYMSYGYGGVISNVNIKGNKFMKPVGLSSPATSYTVDMGNSAMTSFQIENNYFDSCVQRSAVGGISALYSRGKINILKNIIIKRKGADGIHLENCVGGSVADSAILVANNFITLDSSAAAIGIYAYNMGRNTKIVYNNILNNGTNTSSRALQFSNYYVAGTLKDTIANNNLFNTQAGHSLYLQQATASDVQCNNNNIFVTGSAILTNFNGTNYTTIPTFQTAGGTFLNNVSKNPLYVSSTDLHVLELSLRTNGTPLSYVTNDIDNDARGLVNTTIGADEIVVSSLDMGVSALVTPIIPFAAGSQDITVTLKNYGTTPVTNTTVNWSVNGTVQTPFNYTGNIAFGNTVNTVIANYNFVVDSAYNIKFWTSNPNGSTDNNLTNDSTIVPNFYPALNGTYTLGGAAPDFKSFVRSTANLKYGGMLGNVIFNVRDGRYNEAVRIDSIPFQNNYNATWQSESADSSKVVIAYTATLNDNVIGVLQFDKAKNIIIKKMTIQAKLPLNNYYTAPSFKSVIYFSTKNKNIQLLSNQIIDSTTVIGTTFADGCLLIYNNDATVYGNAQRSKDSAILIDRNFFKETNNNQQAVIDLSGYVQYNFDNSIIISSNYLNNCTISNNSFDLLDISKQTLLVANVDSLKVISNKITGRSVLAGKDYLLVDKNDFYMEASGKQLVTIIAGTNRAANKPCIISNNMIHTKLFGDPQDSNYGLYVTGDRANIIHNTMATSDTGNISGSNYGSALIVIGNLDTIKNNILYNINGGNLISTACTNLTSNYNDYVYSNHFSTSANNLANYKLLFNVDANSVENINPYFRGLNDLHASNILLRIAPVITPTNVAYTNDFDGQSRGATVCIGADEFLQPANDMVVLDASPKKVFSEGLNDIKIHVYNNGINPITAFNATASVTNFPDGYTATNAGNINYTFNGNIAPGAEATITLGQMNVPLYRNILKVNTTNLSAGPDEVPFDDSLQYNNYYAGLNGNYTFKDSYINAYPAITFSSFEDMRKQLKFGGVYGPSTLSMKQGIYTGYLYLDSIPNRGALSPLIIKSESGDSSNTGIVEYGLGTPAFTLFNANHVTVKNLYFGPAAGGTAAPNQLQLGYNSQYISIENCKIVNAAAALTTATATSTNAVFMSGNWANQPKFTDSNYTFKNNLIIGGLKGITVGGTENGAVKNVKISNNKLINQYNTGIEIGFFTTSTADSNVVETNTVNDQYAAINLNVIRGKTTIAKNKINIIKDGFGIYDPQSAYNYGTPVDTLQITNNFITFGESKPSSGIFINNTTSSKGIIIAYNSINNKSVSAASSAYNSTTNAGKSTIINNIFFNKFTGIPVIINKNGATPYIEHHNNLFTSGTVYGKVNNANYTTLAGLGSTGVEYNSVSGDPLFINDTDLHADGAIVNNSGSYDANAFTTIDIDNETRSASNPDIGADEFNLPDYGIVQLASPQSSCSHTATEIVKVYVKNFGLTPRSKIPVAYRINGGTIVRDTANISLNAGDSALFSFTQTVNLAAPINYNFELWSDYRGDSLRINDTLKTLVATTPANNVLPYYTGFEGTAAGWYTGGQNSSFKWGVIFSGVIDSAANGLNAWKSNLTGPYRNNENSYLYSPCFDLTAVTEDPTLNFNLAYQLENNTDKAWVEYSTNAGSTWTKLGVQGEGLGWYNNAGNYWTGNNALWHNAKHLLPIFSNADRSAIKLRFVLQTNNTVVQDGLAIDDVSIYVQGNTPVSSGTFTNRTGVSSGTGTFVQVNDPSGNRIVEINDNGQILGTITVDVNQNPGNAPTLYNGNSYLGRSFVISVQNAPVTPVSVRLFITQVEFDAWKAADPTIDQVRSLSVYKFSGTVEDFSLSNNIAGTPLLISAAKITKIPYLDGYFLEFSVSSFSEFWITKTGSGAFVVPVRFIDVKARLQHDKALVSWHVANEQNVSHYEVMHSTDGNSWRSVGRIPYQGGNTLYNFTHYALVDGINYYQIKQVDINGPVMLSHVVSVNKGKAININVYPTVFTTNFKVDNGSNKKGMIQIYSADGKVVLQYPLSAGINLVNAAILAKGIYLYKIIIDATIVVSGRLVKG